MSTDDLFPPDSPTTGVEPADEIATTPAAAVASADAASQAPRTRWAAIVWGLVFVALAVAGIALTSDDTNFGGLLSWIAGLGAATAIGYGLLTVGILVLIVGVVGLLRRAQKGLTVRRAAE